eukprot:5216603-Prymnesium_polylepis.1
MGELQMYHRTFKKAFLEGDGMGTIVRILASCLNEPEATRSDEQGMIIELILALILNLLHTYHPDAQPAEAARATDRADDTALLRKLVVTLDKEHGLDVLLYIMQQVEESPMIRPWNLTLLEI